MKTEERLTDLEKYKGELVVIKRTQFGKILKLLGPYRVINFKRNNHYDVERIDI